MASLDEIKQSIRSVKDYPKAGINYYDLTTLFSQPDIFDEVLARLGEFIQSKGKCKIVAIEARGFILGAALAGRLHLPFVPVRKAGKLPSDKIQVAYELEYGHDMLEMHTDAITAGDKVIIADDLIATGGTVEAACQCVERLGGEVLGIVSIVSLPFLPFKQRLKGYELHTLIEFQE